MSDFTEFCPFASEILGRVVLEASESDSGVVGSVWTNNNSSSFLSNELAF